MAPKTLILSAIVSLIALYWFSHLLIVYSPSLPCILQLFMFPSSQGRHEFTN